MSDTLNFPHLAHADWSLAPGKRIMAGASLVNGRYVVDALAPVGDPRTLPARLASRTRPFLLGVDFPLGLPEAYTSQVSAPPFTTLLPRLGTGRWARFFDVAVHPGDISLLRPFYPHRPGGTRQAHLLQALNVPTIDALRRRCDQATSARRAAAPLFWTLGAQQVGKAALAGWRDLLQPALAAPDLHLALWPFDGPLATLARTADGVVAETYPGECYHHLGLDIARQGSKQRQADRRRAGRQLAAWVAAHDVVLSEGLQQALADGFGPGRAGEDPFDAVVGLLGMINVVTGRRPAGIPAVESATPPPWVAVEGWILGQTEMPLRPTTSGGGAGGPQ